MPLDKSNFSKELEEKRKQEPLTLKEWLLFFIFPFFTPRPRYREDHFSISEFERFKKYGYETKLKQAKEVKIIGFIFWFITILLVAVLASAK